MTNDTKTVVVNGVPLDEEVFVTVMKELQSRKFHYLKRMERVKTAGTREAEQRKVTKLDDITKLLSYASGVPDPTPRRVRDRRRGV